MNKLLFFVLCFVSSISFIQAQADQATYGQYFNQYGQINKDGEKTINYTQEAYDSFQTDEFPMETSALLGTLGDAETLCDVKWNDAIFGTCIGRNNSLLPFDFEGDGTVELIANASVGYLNGYWYILKYDASTGGYHKVYVSGVFEEKISKMALMDVNDDGTDELVFVSGKQLNIVDLSTLVTIQTGQLPFFVKQIRYGDANNDGTAEIIVSDASNLILLNKYTLEVEVSLAINAGDFDIGNVDSDANLEIVFTHGLAIEMDEAGNVTNEYDFDLDSDTGYSGQIILENIDDDAYDEAIVAYSWNKIIAYDVNTNSEKYEIAINNESDAFTMFDVDNDGKKEIIHGDGQFGKLSCYNAETGALIWQVDNPSYGVTGIAFGDFDNDGSLEFVWGGGCVSTGADYLFFYSATTQNFEWRSEHVDGPFYAVEVADVDEDGQKEIITISYSSESGSSRSILTIYDALTKKIEFQSNGDFFAGLWTGVFNMEVADYNSDGDLDIIVAAGQNLGGKIWVVDGDTHAMESTYGFPSDLEIDAFKVLAMNDVDGDGELEFVAANDRNLYIINKDYSVAWTSSTFSGWELVTGVYLGNIDGDSGEEIVLCKDYIYKFDNGNYAESKTVNSYYSSIRLNDWDSDGDLEIIAGTNYGNIEVLDGATLTVIASFALTNERITGIELADLNGDGSLEVLATSEGEIHYLTKDGNHFSNQVQAKKMGTFDALVVDDYDNDGLVNIILGTSNGIIELDVACAQCLWFTPSVTKDDATCGLDNGVIFGSSVDASTVFSVNGQDFSASLPNLPVGAYTVTATNDYGCQQELPISIGQHILSAYLGALAKSCLGPNDGRAYANIIEGASPYDFLWSNGQITDTISDLGLGYYWVTITDANDCVVIDSVNIMQAELNVNAYATNVDCYGDANGTAQAIVIQGKSPYSYNWNTGAATSKIFDLPVGEYSVDVLDGAGCMVTKTVVVASPSKLNLELDITDDDLSTSDLDGAIIVNVTGGASPYFYAWNTGSMADEIYGLGEGVYSVLVTDVNGCQADTTIELNIITAVIELSDQVFHLYPIPSTGHFEIDYQGVSPIKQVYLFTMAGQMVPFDSEQFVKKLSVTIPNISEGNYIFVFNIDDQFYFKKVVVDRP